MHVLFLIVVLTLGLLLTRFLALIPVHLIEGLHLPWWMVWGGVAIALSWLMGDS